MSKHETEMHRQRFQLLKAMCQIRNIAENDRDYDAQTRINMIIGATRGAINACKSPAGGMFETERQLDFADRQDLKRRKIP